jgi:hypothetical protein
VHHCHCPRCRRCFRHPPSILIAPPSICLTVLPLPTAASTDATSVAALSPPLLLTPAWAPHAIDEVGNPLVNIASVNGGFAVAIVVAPNIKDVSVPQEDGITNIQCRAVAAVVATACRKQCHRHCHCPRFCRQHHYSHCQCHHSLCCFHRCRHRRRCSRRCAVALMGRVANERSKGWG